MNKLKRTKWFTATLFVALVGASTVATAEEEAEEPEEIVEEEAATVAEEEEADEAEEEVAEEEAATVAEEEEADEAEEEVAEEEEADEAEEEVAEEEEADEAEEEVAEEEEADEAEEEVAEDVKDDEEEVEEVSEEAADVADQPGVVEQPEQPDPPQDDDDAAQEEVAEEEDDVWGDIDAGLDAVEQTEAGAEATIIEEPFAPTFAFGVETGYFFSDLERFNSNALAPNDVGAFDVRGTYHVDLVAESRVIENLRVSILGGTTFARHSEPSLFGWYVGAEPAYVAGDGGWEMALGLGLGVGGLRISDGDDELATSLTVMRPFVEARRNVSDMTATYARFGFNAWYPRNPRSDEMDLETDTGQPLSTRDLESGGLYFAVGARFGAIEGLTQRTAETLDESEVEEVDEDQEAPDMGDTLP